MRYGQSFSDYIEERDTFFKSEKKNEKWLWLGVITQFTIVSAGAMLLPFNYLFLWTIAIAIGGAMVLSGLFKIWKRQRPYMSFEKWSKHEQTIARSDHPCADRVSKCCGKGNCSK